MLEQELSLDGRVQVTLRHAKITPLQSTSDQSCEYYKQCDDAKRDGCLLAYQKL
jgi:hypothetical protein